jgi:hypothetical protein
MHDIVLKWDIGHREITCRWQQVRVVDLKIQCEPWSIGRIENKNPNGGGRRNPNGRGRGTNNTIIINMRRRKKHKGTDKKCCGSNNQVILNYDMKKNVSRHHMSMIANTHTNENR